MLRLPVAQVVGREPTLAVPGAAVSQRHPVLVETLGSPAHNHIPVGRTGPFVGRRYAASPQLISSLRARDIRGACVSEHPVPVTEFETNQPE
jgi:hypothetical protein